jgi:predicted O-methyltransferase YrrM
VHHYYHEIEGHFDFEDVYRNAVARAARRAHFVEVGSWVGKSSSFLAVEIVNSGKAIRLDCIDTWLGSASDQDMMRRAEGRDLLTEFQNNLLRSGMSVRPVRLPSVVAAGLYEDESLDFVFIDADHEYQSVREDLSAWLPKLKWGGVLAGHDYHSHGRVHYAVRDFLPLPEIHETKNCWCWHKLPSSRGTWIREPDAADYLVFIPHVCGENNLLRALASVSALAGRVVVVDQSPDGLPESLWNGPLYRWQGSRSFTGAMNTIQREAWHRRLPFYFFMHSDAEAGAGAVEEVADAAQLLSGVPQLRWGAIFTNFDALACMNTRAAWEVGCWDETFQWYVADIDYYNRLRWGGSSIINLRKPRVLHSRSSTVAVMPQEEQQKVREDHRWAIDHYVHKWGCHWKQGDGRVHERPYAC